MASERQIAANRRNAKKSTGPKSRSGKKRASKNPFRHGLSVPMSGVGSEAQLKDLSRQFAGEASDAEILAEAARAAHAQLDLTRIRSVHTAMLKRALMLTAFAAEPFHPDLEEPGLRGAQADWPAAKRRQSPPHPKMLYPSITLPGCKDEERWAADAGHILLDLTKVCGYEKRAAGRRDRAIGKIQNRRQERLQPLRPARAPCDIVRPAYRCGRSVRSCRCGLSVNLLRS
jgi:hypothetical protein